MADLYNKDYFQWAQHQAQLIKEGRFSELDLDNLVEEVESMGKSEPRSLKRHLMQLLAHLLKWQYQAQQVDDLRDMAVWFRSWSDTIREQRRDIQDILSDSPSLNSQIYDFYTGAYQNARREAAKGLNTYIDSRSFSHKDFPETCPWSFEQIMEEDFLPDSKKG